MVKFAIHVMAGAGLGVPFEWDNTSDDRFPKRKVGLSTAYRTVLDNLFAFILPPKIFLKLPNKSVQTAVSAYNEVEGYMYDLLEREQNLSKDVDGRLNLMSALVKHGTGEGRVISNAEIKGNIFILLLAGHESTYSIPGVDTDCSAHTMMYAFTMLALHQEIQATLVSEIRQVCGDR